MAGVIPKFLRNKVNIKDLQTGTAGLGAAETYQYKKVTERHKTKEENKKSMNRIKGMGPIRGADNTVKNIQDIIRHLKDGGKMPRNLQHKWRALTDNQKKYIIKQTQPKPKNKDRRI